jgi:folate-binding protein YgfZ
MPSGAMTTPAKRANPVTYAGASRRVAATGRSSIGAMTSPLLSRAGAVPADLPDAGVAGHYGDPMGEQRALLEAAGIVDRSNREVLRVSGPDRRSWLHSLTTQHLEALAAQHGGEALVLSPQGHVEHHLVLADDGESTWIDVEPGSARPLADYLESMRFLMRVEVADVSPDWAVLSVIGPRTERALPRLDGAAPYETAALDGGGSANGAAAPPGGFARRMPGPAAIAADLLVPRPGMEAVVETLGLPLAGIAAYDALRVQAGRPRLGVDTDHRSLPHELGWIGTAVHLDKGCYRGQETVARVYNVGHPPRRLVRLHLDGSAERLPGTGDPIECGGKTVGNVGTVARHAELGPIALGVIKRTVPVDAELTAAGLPATQEVVVDPNAGLHVRATLR